MKKVIAVTAAAGILAVGASSGAVAGALITGADIKNGTIQSKDIENGTVVSRDIANATIKLRDVTPSMRELIKAEAAQGAKGEKGDTGATGPQGPKGADGTATYAGPNWSIIDRNVIGNGDAYLRSGPTSNWGDTMVKPPMGIGSLGLRTGSGQDKTAFGNEVDFQGKALADISSVSFWEYTTGENIKLLPTNLASVAMEINPNNGAQSYSTLNYVAKEIPANVWTKITTDEKQWWLTGAAGTATGCNQTTYCTLDEVKAQLPKATLFTVAIGKGRDHAFTGAVDALQIGSTTYDFEPFGVIAKTS